MLSRFPPAATDTTNASFIKGSTEVYAKLKKESQTGQRTVLMTEHTLIFVTKGVKLLHLPDETITASPGEVILLRKGIYVMAEYFEAGLQFEAMMLFLPGKLLSAMAAHVSRQPGSKQPRNGQSKPDTYGEGKSNRQTSGQSHLDTPRCLVFPSTPLLTGFKESFRQYFDNPPARFETLLPLKQQEILLLLLSGPRGPAIRSFIQSAVRSTPTDIDFIVKSYLLQPVTIADLASLANCSLAKFKRDFQQRYECSPRTWINKQRLAHARMLLQNTAMQVAEIAMECGFENTSYFIRLFKMEYGQTPSAERAAKPINAAKPAKLKNAEKAAKPTNPERAKIAIP